MSLFCQHIAKSKTLYWELSIQRQNPDTKPNTLAFWSPLRTKKCKQNKQTHGGGANGSYRLEDSTAADRLRSSYSSRDAAAARLALFTSSNLEKEHFDTREYFVKIGVRIGKNRRIYILGDIQ